MTTASSWSAATEWSFFEVCRGAAIKLLFLNSHHASQAAPTIESVELFPPRPATATPPVARNANGFNNLHWVDSVSPPPLDT